MYLWSEFKFSFVSSENVRFPAFTICPEYFVAYKRDLLKMSGLDVRDLRTSLTYPSNLNMTPSEFFNRITYNMDDIIFSLEIGTAKMRGQTNDTVFKFRSDELTTG